ncbi:MAG: beta-ketoacyl-ACP reductase, partial [Phycisphaeraceae bacterium]|nr:beta-ketoacyl-ACP reductase [Phycisphaeraceae bacterium]
MIFNEFKGKTILITGGSSGIGKSLALNMLQSGAMVGVISNSEEELDAMPGEILTFHTDIRDRLAVNEAVKKFQKKTGKIDMLVNSAGVSLWKDFLDMDDEFWDLIYDVNVKGTFHVSQAVAKYMIQQQSGIIINVASMSGLKSGMPGASAYMSSKWAIVGLSRNLHLEL